MAKILRHAYSFLTRQVWVPLYFVFSTAILFARAPLGAPTPPEYADPFMAFDLGVGGNQHYSAATRRYFTNIVASAVGDLDGDGNDDIVLLANAIPQNGAYSSARPLATYQYSHYCVGSDVFSPPPASAVYWQGEFLNDREFLFDKESVLPIRPNENWFRNFRDVGDPVTPDPLLAECRKFDTLHFAPPSPNIVAGYVDGYTGSDLAWLQGDGRGHFTLHFITPFDESGTRQPARIRMGTDIRLAHLRDAADPGLDIVLISRTNFVGHSPSRAVFAGSTTIEPFTGTSRVMWLENQGWAGANLDFRDHGIAEYNYDRLPVIFYTGFQNASGGWNGPAVTLDPLSVEVMDVDGDQRTDILVTNNDMQGSGGGKGATDLTYDSSDPRMDSSFLSTHYSPRLPRPKNGDRWAANEELWPLSPGGTVRTLFWYKNTPGLPQFSTFTYNQARNDTGGGFTEVIGKMTHLTLAGGANVFVSVRSGTAKIFRRFGAITNLRLRETATQIDAGATPGIRNAFAGNVDGVAGDELIVDYFTCTGGCYDRFRIFSISPSGANVTITPVYSFTFEGDWARHASDGDAGQEHALITVSDLNNDNLADLIVQHFGRWGSMTDPATIFINQTTAGTVNFRPLRQTKPELLLGVGDMINRYSQIGFGAVGAVNIQVAVSTGDFNRDGFTDFVRTGPNLPATLFSNNIPGLQRARVTTRVQQQTGTEKTWTVIYGGEIAGGGVRISTQPIGGIGVQSVQTK